MKFLINIRTNSELIAYEAIALGFTLASFDHDVQFCLSHNSHQVLGDNTSRLYGMIQSLELYDLPPAWVDFDDAQLTTLDDNLRPLLIAKPCDDGSFDTVLEF